MEKKVSLLNIQTQEVVRVDKSVATYRIETESGQWSLVSKSKLKSILNKRDKLAGNKQLLSKVGDNYRQEIDSVTGKQVAYITKTEKEFFYKGIGDKNDPKNWDVKVKTVDVGTKVVLRYAD